MNSHVEGFSSYALFARASDANFTMQIVTYKDESDIHTFLKTVLNR